MEKHRSTIQLIDGKGELNREGLDKFVMDVKLITGSVPIYDYVVVAIMGPQSSGKSTLLNNLFDTKFEEMEADNGRSQTTQGIWMAKSVGIEPFTIVMDLEGSDGRERGQDDTTFEKQSALFAVAISDIVMINMWCHEIGREQAANKPLLRAVFQAMMRIFGNSRKTTLLFVLRDKLKTPLEKLKPVLVQDVEKIWDEVPKRGQHKKTRLDQIFRVEVVALSSYERDEETFKEEVATLRKRFVNSTSRGGLAGDRRGGCPASAFSLSAHKVWEVIKQDRDLDLPSHKVMLANTRCEEILNQKLIQLTQNQRWLKLKEAAESRIVPGLGQSLSIHLSTCLNEYESDTLYFDETVRRSKLELLKSKVLEVLHPAFATMLVHLRSKVVQDFKGKLNESIKKGDELLESVRSLTEKSIDEFDKGHADAAIKNVHWDVSIVRDKLRSEIEAYANSVRNEIRFEENANVIAELKKMNFQNQEQSREQVKKIVEMTEARQKSDQAQIKKLEELHAKAQEKLNRLMTLRAKDQRVAQDKYDKWQAFVAGYRRELNLRNKWGPFYFVRQLFYPSDGVTGKIFEDDGETFEDDEDDATGETFEDDPTGTGKTFDDDATGTGKTFEDDATGETFEDDPTGTGKTFDDDATGETFVDDATGETFVDDPTGTGKTFDDDATGETFVDDPTGTGKTFDDDATGTGKTFEDDATGTFETLDWCNI